MKEKRNIKRENGENEAINPGGAGGGEEEEKQRPLLLANARLVRWVSVAIDRERVHSISANVFILHARKNCEACKGRRGKQLTRDYRKPESIRLYLARFFPPISSRPSLSRVLHSFSTSRQIGFHSFPSNLFAGTLGLLFFHCCLKIAKSWVKRTVDDRVDERPIRKHFLISYRFNNNNLLSMYKI